MAARILFPSHWRRKQYRRFLSTTTVSNNNNIVLHTPIVIVGAGPCGLFLSRLLDSYGTPCTVLEASPSLTKHPQAHFFNTRTMEILRHTLAPLYKRVLHEMPPVDEWNTFRFGYDMTSTSVMAQVLHPVDRPLQANVDANGTLIQEQGVQVTPDPPSSDALSVCSVGHLAQHTFCRLLDEADAPLATVHYNMPVVGTEYIGSDGLHRVYTKDGTTFVAPLVVAADGFHSTLRKCWNISMNGQKGIQHLINVHIRRNTTSCTNDIPPAMLYSIYNPHLVGMMVRHSPHEYVLQIPYFPPYQTVERNFTLDKIKSMVEAAFGSSCSSENLVIESIRPWTMSSLISRRYVTAKGGGVLVGDAAHVFPPAGGFGMNTGLQDVHNLAWRLSLWHKMSSSGGKHCSKQLSVLLAHYEAERRPVAQRNAALSVRNYRRILELSKACYLNDQHPTVLIRLLDQMTLLPLGARQTIFQGLLETAMLPLSALQNPLHPYARLVTNNVRNILEQGGGLPLLFPKFELGFGYGSDFIDEHNAEDWTQDSMGYTPQLKEGYLLPHVELKVVNYCQEKHPNLQVLRGSDSMRVCVTSSDLPAQLRPGVPCFVLLLLKASFELSEIVLDALEAIKADSCANIASVQVLAEGDTFMRPEETTAKFDLIVQDDSSMLSTLLPTNDSVFILIRPDGHVAKVVSLPDMQQASDVGKIVMHSIDQTLDLLD